ncbi:unnamed protein product [Amaranthus hypochondriacus]
MKQIAKQKTREERKKLEAEKNTSEIRSRSLKIRVKKPRRRRNSGLLLAEIRSRSLKIRVFTLTNAENRSIRSSLRIAEIRTSSWQFWSSPLLQQKMREWFFIAEK